MSYTVCIIMYHILCVYILYSGSDTASSLSYSTDELIKSIPEMEKAIKVDGALEDTMYFL